jgi:tetratricopeptide (TPR) repeat protein
MRRLRGAVALLSLLLLTAGARGGLYYSGETVAELPSQWRGFLLDQRLLRQIAVKPPATTTASPARVRYEQAAAQLEKAGGQRKLTPDELADLGALYIRLGETGRALAVLRGAQREHPHHFRIVANLGTAWQVQGDLDQATAALQQAVRLAPGKYLKAEEYQLKLVRLRQRQPREAQDLDDLFGVRYVGEAGRYEPGKLADAERKKLPAEATAYVQQLALWLPADGRLLWQLAELAGAHGDVKTQAAILDGCVTEFGMHHPELRRHRQLARAAAEAAKPEHEIHAAVLRPRSKRPLLGQFDAATLPPVSATTVNALPWSVLAETTLDRQFRPTFAKYLKELDGKRVSLTGYIQPFGDSLELSSFMLIEYPVGCWFCEMPEVAGIVLVELPKDKTIEYTRGAVTVTGRLALNATDPENFLYSITDAKVVESN